MSAPILSARGLDRSFGNMRVLRGLDLDVAAGEFLTIVGRSGAGKSTLLSILGTHDPGYSGALSIAGRDVASLSAADLAALRRGTIGFVFQDFHLLPNLTAMENVMLPAVFSGADLGAAGEQARAVLDHLAVRIDSTPTSVLSRGERQRVAVARGLVNRPSMLIADEPSASLDEHTETVLFDLLDELRRSQGFALIAVVHSTSILERSDRTLVLEDGALHEMA